MDETPLPGRALTFGLSTFHTLFFVMILVVFLYSQGSLGVLLEGLDTLAGYVIFGALWAITWWTTRKALNGYTKSPGPENRVNWVESILKDELELSRILTSGVIWGGVNGFLFLIALALISLIKFLLLTAAAWLGGRTTPGLGGTITLIALLGSPVGAVVGALIGFILALVDGAVLILVRRFF